MTMTLRELIAKLNYMKNSNPFIGPCIYDYYYLIGEKNNMFDGAITFYLDGKPEFLNKQIERYLDTNIKDVSYNMTYKGICITLEGLVKYNFEEA